MPKEQGPSLRVWVELVHHLDAAAWPDRNRADEVPNHRPFGLDELADFGIDVTFRKLLAQRFARRAARAVRARAGELEWVEELRSIANRQRRCADVVLCWDEFTGIPAIHVSRLAGGPPVVSGVQVLSDVGERPAAFRRRGRALQHAAALFVQSRAMLDVLRRNWDLDARRLHYVPFGIDADWFTPTPGLLQPGRVVSVGDDAHRDYDTLIRAVAKIADHRPETRLDIATHLPIDLPAALGTVFRGHLGAGRRSFYGSAAVLALAARPNFHGSGMSVILEAMACGRPYVVTASAGLEDYVADGVDGFVVPAGDADAMARAIETLLADPDMADEMGRAGRARVEQGLTTHQQSAALAELLTEVAGDRRAGRT